MQPSWSTACPDWRERIVAGQSLVPFEPLFPQEAERALEIFGDLILADVANTPTIRDCSLPWIFDLPRALFGSYDPSTGERLIREYLLAIAKKNAKSSAVAAGIGVTALMRNWRQSGEFLIIAPTIEVAENCFGPAEDMVRCDPNLKDILYSQSHLRTITHRVTNATLRIVAADKDTVSGTKAIGVIVEELWVFGKRAGAAKMFAEATGGLLARPEGFVIYLTTQSDEPPAGIFKDKLDYFREVRDGKIDDPRSLALIYEFPEAMIKSRAYLDQANWHIPNPNLGRSVSQSQLADLYKKALRKGEKSEAFNIFLAKHLNVEIGQNQRLDSWAGSKYWEKSADATLTLETLIERCEVITLGVDGGGLDDLLGFAVVGRERDTGIWLSWCHAWVHRDVFELRKSLETILEDLEQAGELSVVDTMDEAFKQLADRVEELESSALLANAGFDAAGVKDIESAIKAREIPGMTVDDDERIVAIPQGYKLSGTIKLVEGRLQGGRWFHAAQALMAWCVGNAKTELRGNALLVTKAVSGTGKIDPLSALFDAGALMSLDPEPAGSVYSGERGLAVFG